MNPAIASGWQHDSFSAAGFTYDTYRKCSGPGVVVHEIPSITPVVMKFADEIVDAGFTVVMPLLVGEKRPFSAHRAASSRRCAPCG